MSDDTPEVTTSDLGKWLADQVDYCLVSGEPDHVNILADRPNEIFTEPTPTLARVDDDDPDNLEIHLDNGQVFTLRIIAGPRR